MILVPGRKRTVSEESAKAISQAIHDFTRPASSSGPVSPTNIATDFFTTAAQKVTAPGRTRPLLAGVFMNQSLEEVLELQRKYNLDIVQLHGNEPLEWAARIPVPVVRKFLPGEPGLATRGYHAVPLLDSGSGSGKLLDSVDIKAQLAQDSELRVILAGGLDPTNVAETVASLGVEASHVIGVDVSSGVEVDGVQNLDRIREFVKAAKDIR